jgi:hypothetical protein
MRTIRVLKAMAKFFRIERCSPEKRADSLVDGLFIRLGGMKSLVESGTRSFKGVHDAATVGLISRFNLVES